jgi:hypothetical protein
MPAGQMQVYSPGAELIQVPFLHHFSRAHIFRSGRETFLNETYSQKCRRVLIQIGFLGQRQKIVLSLLKERLKLSYL